MQGLSFLNFHSDSVSSTPKHFVLWVFLIVRINQTEFVEIKKKQDQTSSWFLLENLYMHFHSSIRCIFILCHSHLHNWPKIMASTLHLVCMRTCHVMKLQSSRDILWVAAPIQKHLKKKNTPWILFFWQIQWNLNFNRCQSGTYTILQIITHTINHCTPKICLKAITFIYLFLKT